MNFGRYRVEQKLGEGPRGEVYKASDAESSRGLPGVRSLQGTVALKVLHANFSQDPRLEKQCLDLVHALRLLPHSELARLLSAGRLPEGRLYLVSEYVTGQNMATLLDGRRPLSVPQSLHIAQSIAQVLASAHQKGLVHLALKPSNLFLIGDPKQPAGQRVKIVDLGVARLVAPVLEERLVHRYLAPEQTTTQPGPPAPPGKTVLPGAPADVYALGVLLYEMLTGRPLDSRRPGGPISSPGVTPAASGPPSAGGSPPQKGGPVPLGQLVPVLPKDLLALNQAMLSREPAARPLMAEVANKLAQLEEDLLIGQDVGNYRVIERLAVGGMGTVFRGENKQIGRQAAIKVMRPQFAQMTEVTKRFLNEARAVNMIRHPSLVEIFEFGQLQNGRPYLIMEFLQGESLVQRRYRRHGKLQEADAVDLMRQVAIVVSAIHEKGIIHRDLKPDNVMIIPDPIAPGGERVKLLDFGIAKVTAAVMDTDSTQVNTHAASLVGTPNYMAPEQFSGAGAVTDKTDVYAVGVMLYELLSGKRPYEQPGLVTMSEPPVPLRQIAPRVSSRTAAVVAKMLAFRPGDRPTMAEVAKDLASAGQPLERLDEDAAMAETDVAELLPVEDVGEEPTEKYEMQKGQQKKPTSEHEVVSRKGTPRPPLMPPPAPPPPLPGASPPPPLPASAVPVARTGRPSKEQRSVPQFDTTPSEAQKLPGKPIEDVKQTQPMGPSPASPSSPQPLVKQVALPPATNLRGRPTVHGGHPWLAFIGGAVVALLGVGLWATRRNQQLPPVVATSPKGATDSSAGAGALRPQQPQPVAKEKDPPPIQPIPKEQPKPAAPPKEALAVLKQQALAALEDGLRGQDAALRRRTVAMLAKSGGTAEQIRPLLADPSPRVQEEAALALGKLGATTMAPVLVDLLAKTTDAHTFLGAADALDQIRHPDGGKRLREGLKAGPIDVRGRAAAILASRGDAEAKGVLGKLLATSPGAMRPYDRAVAIGLVQGNGGLGKLLVPSTPAELRLHAAQQLATQGDADAKATLAQMAGQQGPQQYAAARAHAESGDAATCAFLRKAATTTNLPAGVRGVAAEGLANCGGAAEAQTLAPLLSVGSPPLVRVAAAAAVLSLLRK